MKVTVRLFASLRMDRPELVEFELDEGSLVADAVAAAGLREGEAAVIFCNALRAAPGSRLAEGDYLELFPFVGGG